MEVVKAFTNELTTLYDSKPPISKKKVVDVTKAAMKAIKYYKHVVQNVEKFIAKCKPEYKVPGLYVMDSILRQSRHQYGADKDVFGPRFAKNLDQTFEVLFTCTDDDKMRVLRVFNLWVKNDIFSDELVTPMLKTAASRGFEYDMPMDKSPAKPAQNNSGTKHELFYQPKKDDDMNTSFGSTDYKPTPLSEHQQKKATPIIPSSADGTPSSQHNNLASAIAKSKTFQDQTGGAASGVVDQNFMQHIQDLTKTLLEQQKQADPGRKIGKLLKSGFDYSDEESGDEQDKDDSVDVIKTAEELMKNNPQIIQQIQQMQQQRIHNQQNQQDSSPLKAMVEAARHQAAAASAASQPAPPPQPTAYVPMPAPPPSIDFSKPPPGFIPFGGAGGAPPPVSMPAAPAPAAAAVPMASLPPPAEKTPDREPTTSRQQDKVAAQQPIIPGMDGGDHSSARAAPSSVSNNQDKDDRREAKRRRRGSASREPDRDDRTKDAKRKRRTRSRSHERSHKRRHRSTSRDRDDRKSSRSSKRASNVDAKDAPRRSRSRSVEKDRQRERRRLCLPSVKPGFVCIASRTLWIGRLPQFVGEESIREAIKEYGVPSRVEVMSSKACCYVTLPDRRSAVKVLDKLGENLRVQDKRVRMSWARGRGLGAEFKELFDPDKGYALLAFDKLPSDLTPLCEDNYLDVESLPENLKSDYNESGRVGGAVAAVSSQSMSTVPAPGSIPLPAIPQMPAAMPPMQPFPPFPPGPGGMPFVPAPGPPGFPFPPPFMPPPFLGGQPPATSNANMAGIPMPPMGLPPPDMQQQPPSSTAGDPSNSALAVAAQHAADKHQLPDLQQPDAEIPTSSHLNSHAMPPMWQPPGMDHNQMPNHSTPVAPGVFRPQRPPGTWHAGGGGGGDFGRHDFGDADNFGTPRPPRPYGRGGGNFDRGGGGGFDRGRGRGFGRGGDRGGGRGGGYRGGGGDRGDRRDSFERRGGFRGGSDRGGSSRGDRPSRFSAANEDNGAGGAAPELDEEQKMLAMMGLPVGFGVDDEEKKEKPNWFAAAQGDEQPAPPGC